MNIAVRVVLSILTFLAADFFLFWMVFLQILPENAAVTAEILSLLFAFAIAWFVWRQTATMHHGLWSSIATGAITIGSIAFVAGFFGPILLTPDANQGPLLGLFITGPLGLVIGAIAGAGWWLATKR